MIYHTKELVNLNSPIPGVTPEVESEREMPTLSKVRFGELEVGDRFVFDGSWLVKTGDYNAESDRKRGKTSYLFFKKDVVKYEPPGRLKTMKNVVDEDKPQCSIIITTGYEKHTIEVLEGDDYRWATTFKADLNECWSVPIRLKNLELTLKFDDDKLMLCYLDKNSANTDLSTIWERPFYGWNGVNTCTITIKNIVLEQDT